CGTDTHGISSSGTFDLTPRTSFNSCSFWKAGLELLIHPIPRARFDPWFGFDGGFQLLTVDAKTYDPLGQVPSGSYSFPAITAGGQIGLDIHPIASYWRFAVGPFATYSMVVFGKSLSKLENKDSGCGIVPSCFGSGSNGDSNKDVSPYGNLLF